MKVRHALIAPVAAMLLRVAVHADPVTLPGGTQIEDLETGTGAEARKGQTSAFTTPAGSMSTASAPRASTPHAAASPSPSGSAPAM